MLILKRLLLHLFSKAVTGYLVQMSFPKPLQMSELRFHVESLVLSLQGISQLSCA